MNDMDEYKWDREVDQLHELELKQRNKPMTPIEQAARDIIRELDTSYSEQSDFVIITRHITTLTKPLEDENKRLREALDILEQSLQTAGSFKAWDSEAQEDYYFSQSLAFQNGKKAYQNARAKALTKST